MSFIVTNQQMKNAESAAVSLGVSLQTLMENAGKACFDKINDLTGGVSGKSFGVLCGKGNNGGDGIVIAHHLKKNGANVLCVFTGGLPESECAKESYKRYGEELATVVYGHGSEPAVKKTLIGCAVVVDCVFGTGFHGELEQKLQELFGFINKSCCSKRISVDVPSGANSDTGEMAKNTFIPDVTLTLGAVKQGLLRKPCADHHGQLILLVIGISDEAYTEYEGIYEENLL